MADQKRSRLSSTVVVPQSFRREARDRDRSVKHSESHRDRRSSRESRKRDDNRRDRSPHKRSTEQDNDDDHHENKQRRSWQSERIPVKERLSFVRNKPRQPRQPDQINTDPRDVPRGNRYFEHDDREGFNNQNFNSLNRRRSFPRQRSRSPNNWKHDRFNKEERPTRLERPRQTSWRQRDNNAAGSPVWRQRDNNATGSPVWRHDKFEEMESQESELKDDDKDTQKKRRTSS